MAHRVYKFLKKGAINKGGLITASLFSKRGYLEPVEEITNFLQVAISLAPFFQ